ncbi:MAG: recombinase family protein [Alistipes senegalensis]|nr:recombinase family protein [Alistipes senegalensis]
MLPKQTDYKVGMYLRLSRDDERAGESLSIENQRRILTNHISEQGWTLYDEYVDDGFSGTDFNRPGVQRMLDDAKTGKINLIICKDLSRFGRNYIQVGQYVDYIFPMYNIRFIALNDNVDTANSQSSGMDMLPIMNVFNEWHAANTSKKLRAVFESNAKSGKYMTTFCAYGYEKGTDENFTPVIDPYAANIVRRIFEMRASGMNAKKIADVLNGEHIAPPLDYKYDKLGKEYPLYSHHLWSSQTIKRILKNQIYLGHLCQMKQTTVSYKNHKVINKDMEDWVIIENNHESIISQELWDKCREVDASVSNGKCTKERTTKPLSGLCYCDSCGAKMKQHNSSGSKNPMGYVCGLHARYGKSYCTSHYIVMHGIESIVLADIQRQIDFILNDDEAKTKYLAHKQGSFAVKNAEDKKRQQEIHKRIDDLDKLMQKLYEDRVLGNMPDKVCADLLTKYQQEKENLLSELNDITRRTEMACEDEQDVEEYIRRLKSYAGAETLTRQMCMDLIEYITIDKYQGKKVPRDIHIYYKLIDKPLTDRKNAIAK